MQNISKAFFLSVNVNLNIYYYMIKIKCSVG